MNLAVIGLVTTVQLVLHKACHLLTTETAQEQDAFHWNPRKSAFLAFRCLKGLRRLFIVA